MNQKTTSKAVGATGWYNSSSSSNCSANSRTCPAYFRWIHEDLRPWKESGITEKIIEKGKKSADFRLVVLNGSAYVETYHRSYQTRDVFTIWGILQLLRKYPGRIPDLDLNFFCGDLPRIKASFSPRLFSWFQVLPPVFSYCSNGASLDVPFPDWSFWGW